MGLFCRFQIKMGSNIMARSKSSFQKPPENYSCHVPYFSVSDFNPKVKMFENRKNLLTNPKCPTKYKNISIYEDVTPLRSRIMYELRNRGDRKTFKYVWSRGGRIYCLRPEEMAAPGHHGKRQKPTIINTPEDLEQVGFSKAEIKDIIALRRK